MKNKVRLLIAGSAVLGSLLLSGVAFAQTPPPTTGSGHMWGGQGRTPGVFGTVSAINGEIITITSKGFGKNTTATTYTVDATNATITKSGAASSLGNVAVGDTIMAQGTVSGTSVIATTIRDGMMGRGMGGMKPGQHATSTKPASIIQGNGQPVIGGSITAINGPSLTITNKSNVTYTVNATNAVIEKGNATSSISNLTVGDNVIVQGTVNGTSVIASSVIDSGTNAPASTNPADNTSTPHRGGIGGFFGGIGGFFQHLFGF